MFNFTSMKKTREKKCVYWWEPRDGGVNAGDHLSKIIVQQMLALRDYEISDKKNIKNKLMAIGSVMHFAKNNDCVWGTGINGKVSLEELKFNNVDVRAVRGPKTRKILQERGITVPEVYGDPGLLLPFFFPAETLLLDTKPKKDFIIIPHMNEDFDLYKKYRDNICSPKQGAISFTREIVNSHFVVSSSLHGVIIAEAYGIPAILLENSSGESTFKYDDYYFGTGREDYPIVNNIDDAFKVQAATPVNLMKVALPLMQSFPYDLWA